MRRMTSYLHPHCEQAFSHLNSSAYAARSDDIKARPADDAASVQRRRFRVPVLRSFGMETTLYWARFTVRMIRRVVCGVFAAHQSRLLMLCRCRGHRLHRRSVAAAVEPRLVSSTIAGNACCSTFSLSRPFHRHVESGFLGVV